MRKLIVNGPIDIMDEITKIKAELYDLQIHNCNGQLTICPDGKRHPNDKPCTFCTRILVLHSKLRELQESKK